MCKQVKQYADRNQRTGNWIENNLKNVVQISLRLKEKKWLQVISFINLLSQTKGISWSFLLRVWILFVFNLLAPEYRFRNFGNRKQVFWLSLILPELIWTRKSPASWHPLATIVLRISTIHSEILANFFRKFLQMGLRKINVSTPLWIFHHFQKDFFLTSFLGIFLLYCHKNLKWLH